MDSLDGKGNKMDPNARENGDQSNGPFLFALGQLGPPCPGQSVSRDEQNVVFASKEISQNQGQHPWF